MSLLMLGTPSCAALNGSTIRSQDAEQILSLQGLPHFAPLNSYRTLLKGKQFYSSFLLCNKKVFTCVILAAALGPTSSIHTIASCLTANRLIISFQPSSNLFFFFVALCSLNLTSLLRFNTQPQRHKGFMFPVPWPGSICTGDGREEGLQGSGKPRREPT